MSSIARLIARAASAAVLLASASVAGATAASAQSSSYRGTRAYMERGGWHCTVPSSLLTISTSCDAGDAQGDLFASIDAQNHLHASSHLQATTGWSHQYRAGAEAFFFDELHFTEGAPTQLVFEMSLHGRAQGENASGDLYGYGWGSEPEWGIGFGDNGFAYDLVKGTFIVPVVNRTAIFGLKLLTYGTITPPTASGCDYSSCSDSWADFGNTAWISNITALDANGDAIASGLKARSASGVSYALDGGLVTSAPEPASLVLVLSGLGLMAAARQRRA